MQYRTLRSVASRQEDGVIRQIASLHYQSLSYRSFITSFGCDFLYELEKGIVTNQLGFLVCAEDSEGLRGFVLGCHNSSRLMSVIYRRAFTFSRLIVPRILAKPSLIGKVVESLFYSKAEGVPIEAELLVIAVNPTSRSKGIGSVLVQKMEEEFTRQGISQYKVTVHKEMDKSNKFYLRNGMTLSHAFTFYGVEWNIFIKKIGIQREECEI